MSEQIRCSHILCKHSKSRNPVSRRTGENVFITKEEATNEMKSILDQLKADKSGKLFAELAEKRSDCSSYSKGGDLGSFGRGVMQKSFESPAFDLKVGETSGLVESDSGVHVILRTA